MEKVDIRISWKLPLVIIDPKLEELSGDFTDWTDKSPGQHEEYFFCRVQIRVSSILNCYEIRISSVRDKHYIGEEICYSLQYGSLYMAMQLSTTLVEAEYGKFKENNAEQPSRPEPAKRRKNLWFVDGYEG